MFWKLDFLEANLIKSLKNICVRIHCIYVSEIIPGFCQIVKPQLGPWLRRDKKILGREEKGALLFGAKDF